MESWTFTDFDPTIQHEKFVPQNVQMYNILTYVWLSPATTAIQIISESEILATDKIHIDKQNPVVLPELRRSNNGIYNMQNSQLTSAETATF